MEVRKNIKQLEDIKLLVDSFYGKVRKDEMLGPIFNQRIGDKWPQHLQKMYRFWQTVLLDERTYYGSPFLPHANLPVEKEHFNHWLKLFFETIDENFIGEKAERAKWQGQRMADMFHSKIQFYKNHPSTPLI